MPRTPPIPTAVALVTVLLLPEGAAAGGFHISIVGVRRTGMMTNLGDPDDVTALFHNPAGLADQPGTRVHLSSGFTLLDSQFALMELDGARFPEINPAGCDEQGKEPCPWPVEDGYYSAEIGPERYFGIIPYVGVTQGLDVISPGLKDVVVSFAAYAPGAYGAFLPKDAPTAYYVTEGLFIVGAATLGFGWRLTDWLSVGANVSYTYVRLGYAQKLSLADSLTGRDEEVTPFSTGDMAQRAIGDLEMEYLGDDHGVGWGLGALVSPLPWLALGVSYSGWTAPSFEGDLTITGLGSELYGAEPRSTDQLREDLASLPEAMRFKLPHSATVEMAIPPALMAGVNLTPTDWLEIGLDVRWWFYSIFEEQKMVPHYDGSEPGSEPLTAEDLSKDKRYSDSFEVALGVLVRPVASYRGLELMAGVAFDRSPVPDETFSIDNPSMNQAIGSLGVRTTVGEHVQVGVAYMLINYLERNVTTSESSPPVNVRVRGRSHIPTFEVEGIF